MTEIMLATRPATESDFHYIWNVYSEFVKPHVGPHLKEGWQDSVEAEKFRKIWKATDSHIILVDGLPIGWGAAAISENQVQLEHLYIEPSHREKGYATRLVSEMTKQWTEEGKTVVAPILKEERLTKLATQLGFEKSGVESDHPLTQTFTYMTKQ